MHAMTNVYFNMWGSEDNKGMILLPAQECHKSGVKNFCTTLPGDGLVQRTVLASLCHFGLQEKISAGHSQGTRRGQDTFQHRGGRSGIEG